MNSELANLRVYSEGLQYLVLVIHLFLSILLIRSKTSCAFVTINLTILNCSCDHLETRMFLMSSQSKMK